MNFLTEDKFIHLFDSNIPTFKKFMVDTKVKTSSKMIPLLEYYNHKKIPKDDILDLYNHIKTRKEYLARFYKMSLEPVIPLTISDSPMYISNMSNNAKPKYKNTIRNLYYNEILKTTQSGLENLPTFLSVLEDLYKKGIIDYKILTPSSRYYIKNNRIGSVFSSYYFRASIMNPYLVYSLNHRILMGQRIFTPTLGWSSYCYGFMECPFVKEYVGVDVIPKVCDTTLKFANKYYPTKTVDIYCQPSETLLSHPVFIKKYTNHFDVVFFSPPYYRLELYEGKSQSTTAYKTYEEWLEKYWKTTIELTKLVLQKNGRLCYIISNYGAKSEKVNLIRDLNRITQEIGFKPYKQIKMKNKSVSVNVNQENNDETICVFIKS